MKTNHFSQYTITSALFTKTELKRPKPRKGTLGTYADPDYIDEYRRLNYLLTDEKNKRSWKMVREKKVMISEDLKTLYVLMYFPVQNNYYMIDVLEALQSQFTLTDKLALLEFVVDFTRGHPKSPYKERENSFMKKYLVAGDKGTPKCLIMEMLGAP